MPAIDLRESRDAYNHTKLWIVDDEMLFVGSANLDYRSAELNFEMSVVVRRGVPGGGGRDRVVRRTLRRQPTAAPPRTCPARAFGRHVAHGACRLISPLL